MDIENLGVNEPEVADPVTEGVNEPEVADPVEPEEKVPDGNSASEAWARIRRESAENARRAEEAERALAEMQAQNEARATAISRLTGRENGDIEALAESMDVDSDELLSLIEAEQDSVKKDREIETLQGQIASLNADRQMQADLIKIQAIDPEVTSLEQLGDSFGNYIKAGLSAEDAYFAVKSREQVKKPIAPKAPGKVNNEPPKKDFFTEAEVDAMTPEQQKANYKLILASMPKW